ncbi:hypothetical protein ABTK28_20870, partial [Acinetobacter baumannii]
SNDSVPPLSPLGYKPVTGPIFDLFTKYHISWADYYQDIPQSAMFVPLNWHHDVLSRFYDAAAGKRLMPQMSFIDGNFGDIDGSKEND